MKKIISLILIILTLWITGCQNHVEVIDLNKNPKFAKYIGKKFQLRKKSYLATSGLLHYIMKYKEFSSEEEFKEYIYPNQSAQIIQKGAVFILRQITYYKEDSLGNGIIFFEAELNFNGNRQKTLIEDYLNKQIKDGKFYNIYNIDKFLENPDPIFQKEYIEQIN